MEVKDGYKQTEVGIIPADWEVIPIGDYFSISVGRDLREENYSTVQDGEFKYPVFSNTVSYEGLYGFYNFPEYNGESLTIVGRGVGLGTAFKRSGGFGAIGRLLVLFPKENVNAAFVTEYINHRVKIFTESGGIPQLTGISIAKYRIPLPPTLTEQEAIAEALSDEDALIEALEQLIAKKRQVKQGAMQELITGKRRLKEFVRKEGYKHTEVGDIPEDWNVQLLGSVVMFLDGQRRPVKDADRAKMRGTIPYYGASGIVDYVNDYLFDEDLILLGEDGENILSRNTRLAFRISGKTWVNNHAHVLRPNPDMNIGFLVESLEAINYERFNSGTAQPKLNKQTCYGIPVALPPTRDEQTAIAEILSDMDAEIAALEGKLSKAREVKTGMMQELLTGRVRLV